MERYQNVGTQPILDNRMPGEIWNGTIPEGQKQFLVGIGALKVISTDVGADDRLKPSNKRASTKKKA